MKKFALALVAGTIAASAASANISTGFYLGAHVGYGSTTADASYTGTAAPAGRSNVGHGAGSIGLHAGYGMVSGCWYFGGELFYTFENTKITSNLAAPANTRAQLKRNGVYGIAARIGWLITPSAMTYIRLGAHAGKWQASDNTVVGTTNLRGSKNRISFAPGVGMEIAMNKNVYLRGEYTYEFGPSVRGVDTDPTSVAATVISSRFNNIRSQRFTLGVTYKF